MTSNISFKSKINFVPLKEFINVIDKSGKFVPYGLEDPLFTKASSFYTETVRTCAAGGFTDTKENAFGFHILDCLERFENIKDIGKELLNQCNPMETRGLLVGGKDLKHRPYSMPIINTLRKMFELRLKALSYFIEHTYLRAETFFHYDLKTDTWTMLLRNYDRASDKYHNVVNPKELMESYAKIHIAEGDVLMINGERI